MKGIVKLDEKHGIYFFLEDIVKENVESGRYKDIEAVCGVFVESLLWKNEEVVAKMAEKFDSSELSQQYIALLKDCHQRNALMKSIHSLCKKFSPIVQLAEVADIGELVNIAVKDKTASQLSSVFVRVLSLLVSDKRGLHEFKLIDDEVNVMLKVLVQAYYAVYDERVILTAVDQSALTVEQIEDIFNFYANDIKLHYTLLDQKQLTPLNRDNYYHLLTKPQHLTLKLCSPSLWHSHDVFFIGESLNERSSLVFELENIRSYLAFENKIIIKLITQLTGVEVITPYDLADSEKQAFKKLEKNAGREIQLDKQSVTFLPSIPRASETTSAKRPSTLTLFSEKAKALIKPAAKHAVRPH